MIPVIDLFAGPGGLGEGFSSITRPDGTRAFKIQLSIEKDGQRVTIFYIDPGFIPAQITVSGFGVELEKVAAEKQ